MGALLPSSDTKTSCAKQCKPSVLSSASHLCSTVQTICAQQCKPSVPSSASQISTNQCIKSAGVFVIVYNKKNHLIYFKKYIEDDLTLEKTHNNTRRNGQFNLEYIIYAGNMDVVTGLQLKGLFNVI